MTNNFDKLLSSIKWQDDLMSKMKGFDLSAQIAHSFSNKVTENHVMNTLTGGMRGMMAGLELTPPLSKALFAQRVAWEGIAGSLNHLVAMQSISENLAQTALLGQLGLHGSLTSLAQRYQVRFHNPFSVMDAAIHGVADRVFRQHQWEQAPAEVQEVNEVFEGLCAITAEQAELDRPVTAKDLEKFRASMLDELVLKLRHSKTALAIEVILGIMHVIGFALHLHAAYVLHNDISNRELLEQITVHVDSLVKDAIDKHTTAEGFRWNTRVANCNVNLRRYKSTRSEILDTLEEGEQVVVIAVRKKWLYISYIDGDTGEPRSGYALKKYFDRE